MSATPSCSTAPGRSARPGHELAIVFRDHSMSDQVGFHYQRSPGPVAAADFLGKVHAIGDACRHNPATLVPVILDGENCWEYYPDGGVSFLRSLYQGAARDPRIRPVTVGEFLREHPPEPTPCTASSPGAGSATTSPSGSATPKTTAAGTRCTPTRAVPGRRGRSPAGTTPATLARAWDEIYIAEGSDWFWWYGDDHSSALDALFDHLFRKHLRNVYTLLGCDPPGSLFTPISQAARPSAAPRPADQLPERQGRRPGDVLRVDRRGALCLRQRPRDDDPGRPRACSDRVWFGFDAERLLIRVDTEGGPAARAAGRGRPAPHRLRRPGRLARSWSWSPARRGRSAYLNRAGPARRSTATTVAGRDRQRSSSWPSRSRRLGLQGRATRSGSTSSCSRATPASTGRPARGSSSWPSRRRDFERIMWQV